MACSYNYTNVLTQAATEYMRYSRFGRLVFLDFGGLNFYNGNRSSLNFTNIPVIRTRFVIQLVDGGSSTAAGGTLPIGYAYASPGSRVVTFYCPNGLNMYGQAVYLTD